MADGTIRRGMRKGLTRYGDEGFSLFLRKAFIKAMGYSDDALSRPVVGIADTGSDYNACHASVPRLVEAVKRGVMLAGGLPMAFPTISLHESFAHPTSMFLRNLMAMDTEEMVRAQPMDAVVLIGGCDKTIPAQLMAAASADVPALVLPTGPMMTGHWRGERLGACTDCRRFWGMYRAGELGDDEIEDVNDRLAPTAGTCMVMGTASTMACMTEALGMMLPGGATIPAVHADRERFAERTGRRAVEIAAEDLRPSRILGADAFHNSLVTLQAIGGSTNALVHITAVAGRLGLEVDLEEFDAIGRRVPVLVDLKPSGDHYMEHLHDAGGLNAVLRELRPELRTGAPTVSGRTLGENIELGDRVPGQTVVRNASDPIHPSGGMAVLRGNLAPGGAVIKHSAASPGLLDHAGRAVVFDSLGDRDLILDLSNNRLTTLRPDIFSALDNLVWLDLAMNQLPTLPSGVFDGLTKLNSLYLEDNPGASFTFTMTIERVSGADKVVVVVAEGAPFDMTTTVSASGGALPDGVTTVTVPTGHTRSNEIAVTPLDGATVSLGLQPNVPADFDGIRTAVGGPVTF